MYNYVIGYGGWESNSSYNIQHEKQFSVEELGDMIAEASVAIVKGISRPIDMPHGFSDIIYNVVQWLIDNKGFSKLPVEAHWHCCNEDIFVKELPEIDDGDNRLWKIQKALIEAGYTEMDDPITRLHYIETKCFELTLDGLCSLYSELLPLCDGLECDDLYYSLISKISWAIVYEGLDDRVPERKSGRD